MAEEPEARAARVPDNNVFRRDAQQIMNFLVAEIIAHTYEAGSDLELLRSLNRLETHAAIDCGDKYHSTEAIQLVEHLC